MEPLLAVKVGCLVALLFLTLICGMAPAFINWFLKKSVTGIYELILCLISSFAAGIFLGACLLHVVADFLSDAAEQLAYINYPMGELILSLGFFFVLLIERIVLQTSQFCKRNTQDGISMDSIPSSPDDYQEKVDPPSAISMAPENPHNHVHTQVYSSSSFRSLILFCSLSIHSVFEGLAIGLQSNYSSALQIAIAVLIHKGIIVFSLSLKLIQSMTRPAWLITYIVIFSLMSPIGITIGIIVTLQKTSILTLVQTILAGIASGTFVYVTFLEILPQELNSGERPLLKVFFIIIGFAVMAVVAIWA
ncbi:zinc transporter ZIP2 isoform X2 [Rana temporaria]|uniref:zinc transporter ZIP2 isoform X2 n=1 Tax=Rana temporaria TaxID=8407 RepID=UPI001AAD44E2|nr:zinc transporter ZIP2 isoform X2 [Rana temporaria]